MGQNRQQICVLTYHQRAQPVIASAMVRRYEQGSTMPASQVMGHPPFV